MGELLHPRIFPIVHGANTIQTSTRCHWTNHPHIHSRQAPMMEGASEDISRTDLWMGGNKPERLGFGRAVDRGSHVVELIADGIVPTGAVAACTQ